MLLPLLLLAAAPADAAPKPPERILTLTVYGNDPCPKGGADEIVVCGREPESERYRLPKRFRGKRQEAAAATGSWANTVRELEWVGKQGIPNSCSVIGSYGQTGCLQRFIAQARAERKADKAEAAAEDIP